MLYKIIEDPRVYHNVVYIGSLHSLKTSIGGLVHADSVLRIMSSHGQADAIYMDFSKAFDRVNNKLIIQKLPLVRLTSNELNIVELTAIIPDRQDTISADW